MTRQRRNQIRSSLGFRVTELQSLNETGASGGWPYLCKTRLANQLTKSKRERALDAHTGLEEAISEISK